MLLLVVGCTTVEGICKKVEAIYVHMCGNVSLKSS